ncbi:unnamed protein product [Pocillopora meandrina]|uniref:Uncharacterized protein n=1 Tax=Pocillopora meandrina TaxID=46732 RepID=A0AAU9XWC9_9CNID|nr:unnamed protein product [Pocillopora meandrina]
MRPLPSDEINPETASVMKEYVEQYFREEITKDEAAALPPAVYTKQQDSTKVDLLARLGNDFNSGDQAEGLSSDKGAVQATSKRGNVTNAAFVDDCIVRTYADEYDTDSESNFSERKDDSITPSTLSRSGRAIRAHFRLDF